MSLPVCKFYSLNKTCRFGKHCRFSHCLTSERPPSLSEDKVNNKDEHLLKDQVSLSHAEDINSTDINSPINTRPENEPVNTEQENTLVEDSVGQERPLSNSNRKRNVKETVTHFSKNYNYPPVCNYYLTYGNCRYGDFCRYSHQIPNRGYHGYRYNDQYYTQREHAANIPPRFRKGGELASSQNKVIQNHEETLKGVANPLADQENDEVLQKPAQSRSNERKVCPFFKSGRCWRGQKCKFEHNGETTLRDYSYRRRNDKKLQDDGKAKESLDKENVNSDTATQDVRKQPVKRSIGFKQVFTYADLEEFGLTKIRDVEISVMKKRFPKEKMIILEDKEVFSLRLWFSPTDPDWPFDITKFELMFKVPEDYPKKMMTILLPVDQDLPETVRRYLEVSIKEWLDHKVQQLALAGKVELIFRPFLRWLDRNIEDLVTEALQQLKRELIAKAAGLEFIPAARLKARFQTQSESSENKGEDGDSNSSDNEESGTSEEETNESETDSDEATDQPGRSVNLDPDKKGTEIALQHLQLRENASALMFEYLKLIIQCQRCKNHSELKVLQNKVMSIHCEKCNQNQFVNFRPSLIHQFTSVVGYLDVDGCTAFDLIFQDCRIVVTCLGCSKLTKIDGMVSGQMIDGWCQACNARFKLATEAVKFSQLVPSGINTASSKVVEVPTTKAKKPPKDPAIREGYPLPEFGTCKHYKHSYRWMRFPCCGKAYPCGVCHDKKEDHEMIMATRMICGHCCKEQNYSGSRPCNSCGQHMTKVRSAHWEGGAGCRDKIAMSKNDQQKYKNMNKTQSNHKKKVQGASTKKNTKLRHI